LSQRVSLYPSLSVLLSIKGFAACANFLCARKSGRFLIVIVI